MSKPIIKKISPFDANVVYDSYTINNSKIGGYAIYFAWYGNRVKQNRLSIYNNETNVEVYSELVSTFNLMHIIPVGTLKNGVTYYAKIRVVDDKDETSEYSDVILFTCIATPTFYFITPNFNSGEPYQLSSASLTATIHYYCDNLEYIKEYQFYLYDNSKKLLYTSGELYNRDDISYTFKGLDNANSYYIRCIGHTAGGIEMDTGLHEIYVYYQNPSSYSRVYAQNKEDNGSINITSNLIVIQYNGTESFDYDSGMIDLKNKPLYYNDGFALDKDFTIMFKVVNPTIDATLLTCKNQSSSNSFSLELLEYEDGYRFKLKVPNGLSEYILYSTPILDISETDLIVCFIQRINGLYQLWVFTQSGLITQNNYWFGQGTPNSELIEQYDSWINSDEIPTIKIDADNVEVILDDTIPENPTVNTLWFSDTEL